MQIIIDNMPTLKFDCLFSTLEQQMQASIYCCKLTDEPCELHSGTCPYLKEAYSVLK